MKNRNKKIKMMKIKKNNYTYILLFLIDNGFGPLAHFLIFNPDLFIYFLIFYIFYFLY